ncbi:hypothetical protein EDC94DRAFT_586942 [Helicostylum pulchrum]|nr:hypothetical protein EDC94DRAFT_586942 [Helicostylum pulchrum]
MSSLMSLLLLLLLFQLQGICRKTLKPFYSEHITTSRGRRRTIANITSVPSIVHDKIIIREEGTLQALNLTSSLQGSEKIYDSQKTNYEAFMQGLVRLAVSGKNAIDVHHVKNNILVQTNDDLSIYTIVELYKSDFPINVNQTPSIFGYLNSIAELVEIFNTNVKKKNSDDGGTRPTMRSPVLRCGNNPTHGLHPKVSHY